MSKRSRGIIRYRREEAIGWVQYCRGTGHAMTFLLYEMIHGAWGFGW